MGDDLKGGLFRAMRRIGDLVAYLGTGLTRVERLKKRFSIPGLGPLPHPAGISMYVHRACAGAFVERLTARGESPFPPHARLSPSQLIGRFDDITKCGQCGKEFLPTDEGYISFWVVSQRDLRFWQEILAWHNNRGVARAERGDFEGAIAEYEAAVRFDPSDPVAYANRGAALGQLGEYDKAIADCTRATERAPRFAMPYTNRGCTYFNRGEYEKAIADHTEAIRLDPSLALAYYNRGNAYGQTKQYDLAVRDLTRLIEMDPRNAEAYAIRAHVCRAMGDMDAAAKDDLKSQEIGKKGGTKCAWLQSCKYRPMIPWIPSP